MTVDWFAHRKGVRLTMLELAGRIAADVSGGGPVGVMLHHAVTDDEELAAIAELLKIVSEHELAEPTSIMAVAA